ncbi:aldehyde dehydrogenase [Hyphomonas sp. ND6WE1B]|uniref:aldehyde dehydrogenase n=1 Tax=Hyphomonas sp. ND6WE1B TaxID=1848191 RepID=UPI00080770FB|nr:aldehyde dehydrogenase [Hyphomonas sp. ND6WE1B]
METGDERRPAWKQLYIGGEWTAPVDGEICQSIDPSTGEPWAEVALGGPADIDRAVEAASDAFTGTWGRMAAWERAAILRRFADLYQKEAPRLAELETRDVGRAIRETRMDVGAHSQWYHWFASLADKCEGQTLPLERGIHAFTTRQPLGVVGAITPWNVPLLTACWKVGSALAAGCTVVLKPSEYTAVTSLELAGIAEAAGIPPGVINVVPGMGRGAGERLVGHADVAKISFTGSGATARKMLADGAGNLKRFTFELGGKAAHILFDDCDLDAAINAATSSAWAHCGQACALGSRVLVHRNIYDRVVEAFSMRQKSVRVGLPQDERTHMGPQAHAAQLEKSLSYVEIGKQEGAELVAGGKRIEGALSGGYFIEPTVFCNAHNSMQIARDEIFGPVATIIPFDDEEEALRIANDSDYGLTAGLWTKDVGRALRVSQEIEAGIVWVNTYRYLRWSTPYGGFKASGWGRENGTSALEPYQDVRTTVMSASGQFSNPYEN